MLEPDVGGWESGLGKPIESLSGNSRFCYLHFKDEDIIKGYEILGVFHEHKRWRLKAEAKPTLHLGC